MVVSLGKGSSAIPDVIKGSSPPQKKYTTTRNIIIIIVFE